MRVCVDGWCVSIVIVVVIVIVVIVIVIVVDACTNGKTCETSERRLEFSLISFKKKYYLVDLYHSLLSGVCESVLFSRLSPIIFV